MHKLFNQQSRYNLDEKSELGTIFDNLKSGI